MPVETSVSHSMVLLSYWQSKHQEIIGAPYMTVWGKDNTIMKDIIGTYGIERTRRLIDLFFGAVLVDSFLQNSGATVGVFKTQIPKLLLRLNEREKDEPTGRL